MATSVIEIVAGLMLTDVATITNVKAAYRGVYQQVLCDGTKTVHAGLTMHGDGWENASAYSTKDARIMGIFRVWGKDEDQVDVALRAIRGLWTNQSNNAKWDALRTAGVQKLTLMPFEPANPTTPGAEIMAVQPILFTYRETY